MHFSILIHFNWMRHISMCSVEWKNTLMLISRYPEPEILFHSFHIGKYVMASACSLFGTSPDVLGKHGVIVKVWCSYLYEDVSFIIILMF